MCWMFMVYWTITVLYRYKMFAHVYFLSPQLAIIKFFYWWHQCQNVPNGEWPLIISRKKSRKTSFFLSYLPCLTFATNKDKWKKTIVYSKFCIQAHAHTGTVWQTLNLIGGISSAFRWHFIGEKQLKCGNVCWDRAGRWIRRRRLVDKRWRQLLTEK